jgi:5'-phosphate synthase pdxT subunit
MKVGILAFQGDVSEHIKASSQAARNLNLDCGIVEVRTKESLIGLDGLIIPGGESTTLYKLCEREGMLARMGDVKNIFGTCAGAIMLAKSIHKEEAGQKTLALMDIEMDRNGYGRQMDSFEEDLETKLGRIHAVFIRAPRIISVGGNVSVLAKKGREIVACEQRDENYFLATCFHPELTTTIFHERFLKSISSMQP